TRLPKSSNVTAGGTVSALTKLANTAADRSTPSAAAITRQNFRSLSVGFISINIQVVPGVEAPRRPRFGPRGPAIVYLLEHELGAEDSHRRKTAAMRSRRTSAGRELPRRLISGARG